MSNRPPSLSPAVLLLAIATLLLATFIAYLPALSAGYIWDDLPYVTRNPLLRSTEGLARIWTEPGATPQYYPLVFTTYWLEFRLWGLHPAGYHAVNVLLHAANAILLWVVMRRLRVPAAGLIAAVFALHPMHVQSVAWIAERKNVLSGALALLCFIAYFRWRPLHDDEPPGRPALYFLALAAFLGTLLAKTALCTLPAAFLLIIWWKRGRLARPEIVPLIPFFILGALFAAITIFVEATGTQLIGQPWELTPVQRVILGGRAACFYAAKLLLPIHLTHVYPRWDIDAGDPTQYAYPIAVILLVIALWFARERIGRAPLTALLFFLGTLLPTLGLIDFAYMQFAFVADHFVYIPSIGLFAMVIGGIARGLRRLRPAPRRVTQACAAVLLLTLAVMTMRQARIYENEETLWRDTLRKSPNCLAANFSLGSYLTRNGRHAEAISYLETAFRTQPTSPPAFINLGAAYSKTGRVDDAIRIYEHVLAAQPRNSIAHYNMSLALAQQEHPIAALEHLIDALRNGPGLTPARQLLPDLLLEVVDELVQADDAARAVRLADAACDVTNRREPRLLRILAAACKAAGDDACAAEARARAEALEKP
jgi:tetratricopeptide (TPR) repeat protein